MQNLTGDKYIDYVDEVGIDEAEQSIKSYHAAAILSTVLLIIFVIVLQLFTMFTARNESFSQKQAIITGAVPLIGPVYLMVKLAFLKSVSSVSLFLMLIPCIVMCLYSMGMRRKRAFLHNAICMIAEKSLIPEDIIQPSLFEFRTENTKNKKQISTGFPVEILDDVERLIISDVEYEEEFNARNSDSKLNFKSEDDFKTKEKMILKDKIEPEEIFVTTLEATEKADIKQTHSKQDEVDRLINEILNGKK